MILGRHNCHLTAVKDEDGANRWTGDYEALLRETLQTGDAQQGDVWQSYLAVPSNLPVTVEPGDKVVFTWNGAPNTREVRDVRTFDLFGVIRLVFSDR